MIDQSSSALRSLILTGIVPFITLVAIAIQFFSHYRERVRDSFETLEADIKTFVRQHFVEMLGEDKLEIRDAGDSTLTLSHIRQMGRIAHRWYYYNVALWKTLVLAALGATFVLTASVITYTDRTSGIPTYHLEVPILRSDILVPLNTYYDEFLRLGAIFLILAVVFGITVIYRYTIVGNDPEVKIKN